MRIRQVKPSFWTDDKLAAMPAAVRLFYVGLWMVADDAGWLRWSVPEIANELYGYESRRKRERDVVAFARVLEEAGRVKRFDCGHAIVPTLTDHQRFSGATKQVHTVEKEHRKCGESEGPRTSPQVPATPRPVSHGGGLGDGTGRVVPVSQTRKRDDEELTEFQAKVDRKTALGGVR